MSTLSRKLQLLRMLRDSPDGIRLKDAAERLEVSKLTIQRDIDELSASAIQIGERSEGQTHLYFLCDQGASLPLLPSGLEPAEIASLEAARAAFAPFRPSPLVRKLDGVQSKLTGTAANRTLNRFEGSRQRALRAAPASILDALLEGILANRRCEVSYRPRWSKRVRLYKLEPLGLRLLDGLIYLEARVPPAGCRARGAGGWPPATEAGTGTGGNETGMGAASSSIIWVLLGGGLRCSMDSRLLTRHG